MSSLFKSDAKRRAGTRLITGVIRELQAAFESEKKNFGLTQAAVAEKVGTSATVISRWLKGAENLTLRSIAELAWAMGYEVVFRLQRRSPAVESKGALVVPEVHKVILHRQNGETSYFGLKSDMAAIQMRGIAMSSIKPDVIFCGYTLNSWPAEIPFTAKTKERTVGFAGGDQGLPIKALRPSAIGQDLMPLWPARESSLVQEVA